MRRSPALIHSVCLLLAGLTLPGVAFAKDAASILQTMQEKQMARTEGVDAYSVTRQTMGQTIIEYYRRIEVAVEGSTVPVFVRAQANDFRCGTNGKAMTMTPEALEAYADGLEMTGDALAGEIENGLAEAGLPRHLFTAMGKGGDPWATTDMRQFTGGMATFARGAAGAKRNQAAEAKANAAAAPEMQNQLERFAAEAKLVGTEKIGGRKAFHLRADGLNQVQEADGQKFVTDVMNLWVDSDEYVPRKMEFSGTLTSGKETRPFSMEKEDSDYRRVADSQMYESYQQVMRMGGVMDKAQEAEMRKAKKEMAKLEKQLAEMPASQRQMMEKMMGGQLDMVRKMAEGGGFEVETNIKEIKVLPLLDAKDCAGQIKRR